MINADSDSLLIMAPGLWSLIIQDKKTAVTGNMMNTCNG